MKRMLVAVVLALLTTGVLAGTVSAADIKPWHPIKTAADIKPW